MIVSFNIQRNSEILYENLTYQVNICIKDMSVKSTELSSTVKMFEKNG